MKLAHLTASNGMTVKNLIKLNQYADILEIKTYVSDQTKPDTFQRLGSILKPTKIKGT